MPAIEGLRETTQAWARAWAAKNLDAYIGFYAPSFVGNAGSHATWAEMRRRTIERSKDIRIILEDIQVQPVTDTKAQVVFRQIYRAVGLDLETTKTLTWERNGTRWLIVAEVSSGERRTK
jgi:adhesin transport system outer membrane protein